MNRSEIVQAEIECVRQLFGIKSKLDAKPVPSKVVDGAMVHDAVPDQELGGPIRSALFVDYPSDRPFTGAPECGRAAFRVTVQKYHWKFVTRSLLSPHDFESMTKID